VTAGRDGRDDLDDLDDLDRTAPDARGAGAAIAGAPATTTEPAITAVTTTTDRPRETRIYPTSSTAAPQSRPTTTERIMTDRRPPGAESRDTNYA
jgi:hypothetical protein